MKPSSRTPEGEPNRCPACGKLARIAPSRPPGDAPCPHCGYLLWFPSQDELDSQGLRQLRRRFQQAKARLAQGDEEVVILMLGDCVLGDPSEVIYAQSLLDELRRRPRMEPPRSELSAVLAAMNEALAERRWREVLNHGLELLRANPWDVDTLRAMASACADLADGTTELVYLKAALEANPKDSKVNRDCATALARRGRIEEAIECLQRVLLLCPDDTESQRLIDHWRTTG